MECLSGEDIFVSDGGERGMILKGVDWKEANSIQMRILLQGYFLRNEG